MAKVKWLATVAGFLLLPTQALALGGSVQYPDGSPASGAEVTITGGGEGKTEVVCDTQGIFTLAELPDEHAFVKVKAEGKDYVQVRLPASLFANGDVAIVLPARQQKSKGGGQP